MSERKASLTLPISAARARRTTRHHAAAIWKTSDGAMKDLAIAPARTPRSLRRVAFFALLFLVAARFRFR